MKPTQAITCLHFLLTCTYPVIAGGKQKIHIAGLFPMSGSDKGGSIGRGVLPAVRLALNHVNKHPYILPNHQLELIHNDTKVRTYKRILLLVVMIPY